MVDAADGIVAMPRGARDRRRGAEVGALRPGGALERARPASYGTSPIQRGAAACPAHPTASGSRGGTQASERSTGSQARKLEAPLVRRERPARTGGEDREPRRPRKRAREARHIGRKRELADDVGHDAPVRTTPHRVPLQTPRAKSLACASGSSLTLAPGALAALVGCQQAPSGTIQLITGGDPNPLAVAPVPATIDVTAIDSSGTTTTLVHSAVGASTFDLGPRTRTPSTSCA